MIPPGLSGSSLVWAHRIWRASLAGVLATAASAAAEAHVRAASEDFASMSLEELMAVRIETVYGASKYEQKVTRAPASVTIVTAEEIARFGHRTLADIMRSVRGVYVSNDRNYSYFGARGFLRTRISLTAAHSTLTRRTEHASCPC